MRHTCSTHACRREAVHLSMWQLAQRRSMRLLRWSESWSASFATTHTAAISDVWVDLHTQARATGRSAVVRPVQPCQLASLQAPVKSSLANCRTPHPPQNLRRIRCTLSSLRRNARRSDSAPLASLQTDLSEPAIGDSTAKVEPVAATVRGQDSPESSPTTIFFKPGARLRELGAILEYAVLDALPDSCGSEERLLPSHMQMFRSRTRNGLVIFKPPAELRAQVHELLTHGFAVRLVEQQLAITLALHLAEPAALTLRITHWLTPSLLAPAVRAAYRGNVLSIEAEDDRDDLGRAVLHVKRRVGAKLPREIRLNDCALAQQVRPGTSIERLQLEMGRPLSTSCPYQLWFDPVPGRQSEGDTAVAAVVADKTYAVEGMLKRWWPEDTTKQRDAIGEPDQSMAAGGETPRVGGTAEAEVDLKDAPTWLPAAGPRGHASPTAEDSV